MIAARYLYGDSIDQLLARYRPGEGTAWYLTDHLGTVRDIVDAAGALVDHIDYDSFGRVVAESNAALGDRYKFTGREYDSATGLYHYRARWYDPSTGRFVSIDPIGFAAGDANLYRYVGNNPLGATDPFGTTSLSERAFNLARGVVGRIVASATWSCITMEVVGFGVSKAVFADFTMTQDDTVALTLGVASCTFFPTSALAQGAFLLTAQGLYLYGTGASIGEIAERTLMHTIGIAGGYGLSRYGARAWSRLSNSRAGRAIAEFMADATGTLRIIGRTLDDILGDDNLFLRWLKHAHPTSDPLSPSMARKVWDKLQQLGRSPRLDPGHPGTKWDMPHINVDRNVHIPVDPGFTP